MTQSNNKKAATSARGLSVEELALMELLRCKELKCRKRLREIDRLMSKGQV
ncbi:MAG: hypothetical protein WKF84_18140 [Pyrinomonadaceae bacterium]